MGVLCTLLLGVLIWVVLLGLRLLRICVDLTVGCSGGCLVYLCAFGWVITLFWDLVDVCAGFVGYLGFVLHTTLVGFGFCV